MAQKRIPDLENTGAHITVLEPNITGGLDTNMLVSKTRVKRREKIQNASETTHSVIKPWEFVNFAKTENF